MKEERNNLQRAADELLDRDTPHSGERAGSASPGKQSSLSSFRWRRMQVAMLLACITVWTIGERMRCNWQNHTRQNADLE